MKKVEIYNAAIALAQATLNETNPLTFEAAVPQKAMELNLDVEGYQLLSQHARYARGQLLALKAQDDLIAARNAKTADAAKPTT